MQAINGAIILKALVLIGTANTSPLLWKWLAGGRHFRPLDNGFVFLDGNPLLGRSKTWAGIACSLAACAVVAPILGLAIEAGLCAAAAAMAGDLSSSFIKRRLGLSSSAPAPGLDQVPEAILPLFALRAFLPLTWSEMATALLLFVLGEITIASLLERCGLREPPF